MRVSNPEGNVYVSDVDMRRFSFVCGDKDLLSRLANCTKGILGLERSPNSLATQISSAFQVQHKFTLCASKLLIKIPLLINPVGHACAPLNAKDFSSQEYFIDVKGIKIDGKPVFFNTSLLSIDNDGMGRTMISMVTTYRVLHSALYKALVTDFVKEAAAKKMERVHSVAPFRTCFNSKNIAVPNVDLVLKGNNTAWRIYGANSMVKVNKNLEKNLLEFDLASSMLGFSSSLLFHDTSCSQSRLF
ncbi:hypothetical protein ACOSQ3_003638 [Xanthoceras sorbifolium]